MLQEVTEGLSSTKMCLITLQPNQTFHGDLVQCVVIFPLCWLVMANFCATIFALPSMVVTVCCIHHFTAALFQAIGRTANHHFRTGIGKITREVNPQGILFVAGACYCDFNFSVTSWVAPRHTVLKIVLKQILLDCKPMSLII